MDLGLKGKVALIFGASGGLGSAMATSLAKEGAKVALAGRNAAALTTLATSLHVDTSPTSTSSARPVSSQLSSS